MHITEDSLDHQGDFSNSKKTSSKVRGCFLWGCVGTVGIVLIMAVSCVAMFQYGKKEAAPFAEAYLDLVCQGNYEEAYKKVSFEWKKQQSLEEFSDFHNALWSRLGSYESGSVTGVKISATTSGKFADLAYSAKFSNADCIISFRLQQAGDAWLVHGAFYRSDSLEDLYRCTSCETQNNAGATFCSRCGEPINTIPEE